MLFNRQVFLQFGSRSGSWIGPWVNWKRTKCKFTLDLLIALTWEDVSDWLQETATVKMLLCINNRILSSRSKSPEHRNIFFYCPNAKLLAKLMQRVSLRTMSVGLNRIFFEDLLTKRILYFKNNMKIHMAQCTVLAYTSIFQSQSPLMQRIAHQT